MGIMEDHKRNVDRQYDYIFLERDAIALIKKYGLFLPAPAKEFFRKLADFLNWNDLKKEL